MKKILVFIGGAILVGAGVFLLFVPGPGILVLIAGVMLWATEFSWAKKLLKWIKKQWKAWRQWYSKQALWVKILLTVLSIAAVVLAGVGTYMLFIN